MESRLKNFLLVVVSGLPALAISLSYHTLNPQSAYGLTSDEISYVTTSKEILNEFDKSSSFLDSIRFLYEHRVWKGIIIPQIYLVFLSVSQDTSQAVFLFELSFLLVFLTYLSLIFSLFLPAWCSIAGTMMISTMPWLLGLALGIDSYFLAITLGLGAFYHLVRSDYLAKRNHSLIFGLVIGLLCCLRPVEVVLISGIPLLLYLLHCFRSTKPDQKRNLQANTAIVFVSSAAIVSLWWLPFLGKMVHWVESSSTGKHSMIFPKPDDMTWLDFLIYNYNELGSFGFFVLVAIVGSRLILSSNSPRFILLGYLYLAVVPLLVISQFPTLNFNYSTIPFALLWIATALLAFRNLKGTAAHVASLCLFIFALNQMWGISSWMNGGQRSDPLMALIKSSRPLFISRHSAPEHFEKLREILSPFTEDKPAEVSVVHRQSIPRGIRAFGKTYNFIASENSVPIKFSDFSGSAVARKCGNDSSCLEKALSRTEFAMIEIGGKKISHDGDELFDNLLAQERACSLDLIGTIKPFVVSSKEWIGYKVFKRKPKPCR